MRERQQLDGALSGFTRLLRELDDNIELVSLGEEEGDESVIVAEAESALRKLRAEAHKREVEALLSGEADSNDSLCRDPRRRRRHREPGLGADA